MGGNGGQCTLDSTCTAGKDGRCVPAGPLPGCVCTYDTCQHDTDCPAGSACGCHGTPYTGSSGNQCVNGNCRVDGDCGKGGYCSPTINPNSCGSLGGYYCHTASDQCVNDTDCPPNATMPFPGACIYSVPDGRWECAAVPVCA